MKKLITTLSFVFVTVLAIAQVPDIMNYQAVARNNSGQALSNQTIKVRLTINKNAVSQYSETRQVTTNALGLFNVQIGSTGALSTTGSFSGINWQNNAAPGYALKVELDINNTNVFTDMGSQTLVTVPFAFASKKADQATETVNIAGRPVDQTATPTVGARLNWNGTNWTPVKKDTVYNVNYGGVQSFFNVSSNWRFLNANNSTITLTGTERVNVTLSSSVLYAGQIINNIDVAVCYQLADLSGPITPFNSTNHTRIGAMPGEGGNGRYTGVSASGAITLPAGNYIFGIAIRNNTDGFSVAGHTNGTIELKY